MKKWLPFMISCGLTLLCLAATAFFGLTSYLANTGLDLLVSAKKSAPQYTLAFGIASFVLLIISIAILFITKPYKDRSQRRF